MDRQALKEFTYGGIMELMHNRKFFYNSSVGLGYSHWTEEGAAALTEFMNIMGCKMLEAEEKELDTRAKDMVLKNLKGDVK